MSCSCSGTCWPSTPALLWAMSRRPNSRTARSTRAFTPAGLLTSVGWKMARPPGLPDQGHDLFASAASRFPMTTAAPAFAIARAVARPMPVPPPVTTPTFPARVAMSSSPFTSSRPASGLNRTASGCRAAGRIPAAAPPSPTGPAPTAAVRPPRRPRLPPDSRPRARALAAAYGRARRRVRAGDEGRVPRQTHRPERHAGHREVVDRLDERLAGGLNQTPELRRQDAACLLV